MEWITPFRGPSEHAIISLKSIPRELSADVRISAMQDFDAPVVRTNTRLRKPQEGDLEVQVYAFADKHDPEELYVVQDLDDFPAEMDLVVLYSPKKLTYPRPQKSASTRSQSTQIVLVAYHSREPWTLHRDYPSTLRADLSATITKLIPNRLTLVQGVTGVRNYPELIYHRCSASAGSMGGALVNNNGELVGMTPPHELIAYNRLGIQVDGEYNGDGVVDSSCENIGIPLDSPVLTLKGVYSGCSLADCCTRMSGGMGSFVARLIRCLGFSLVESLHGFWLYFLHC
jgi:hypothetical protein